MRRAIEFRLFKNVFKNRGAACHALAKAVNENSSCHADCALPAFLRDIGWEGEAV
jgi:hypothetical protein